MSKKRRNSGCLISNSLDIFGDKWSLLIIRDMIFFGKETYGEFLKSPEKIATNILASRLQNLEKEKVISKKEHPESKAKNLYYLTEKGISLLPILVEIYHWAEQNLEIPNPQKIEMDKDKASFIKEISEKLRKKIELN